MFTRSTWKPSFGDRGVGPVPEPDVDRLAGVRQRQPSVDVEVDPVAAELAGDPVAEVLVVRTWCRVGDVRFVGTPVQAVAPPDGRTTTYA